MVVNFHLHYLGHRIKYGNLEEGNTAQQLLLATLSCWIVSLLLEVILVTCNIGIYICIYFFKISYIHNVLLFSSVLFFLHWMLNILRYEKNFVKLISQLLQSTIHQVMWYLCVFIVNPFSLFWSIFFSRKLCSFALLFSCLSLS